MLPFSKDHCTPLILSAESAPTGAATVIDPPKLVAVFERKVPLPSVSVEAG